MGDTRGHMELLVHPGQADLKECRSAMGETTGTARLTVTYGGPDDVVTPSPDALPDVIGAIGVGTAFQSSDLELPSGFEGFVGVDHVEAATDLETIGQSISGFCDRWASDHLQIVLCYRTFEHVFESGTTHAAVQFTRFLLDRLRAAGARAHFHLDPSAVDGETIDTLEDLFDEVEILMRGAGIPTEESSGRPRYSRSHATDSEIADELGGNESSKPTAATPKAEVSDEEIAAQLGEDPDEPRDDSPRSGPVSEVSDEEIADQLGDDHDESVDESPTSGPVSEVSDEEIAAELGADPAETGPTASEPVSEVTDEDIAAQLEDESTADEPATTDSADGSVDAQNVPVDGDLEQFELDEGPDVPEEAVDELLAQAEEEDDQASE